MARTESRSRPSSSRRPSLAFAAAALALSAWWAAPGAAQPPPVNPEIVIGPGGGRFAVPDCIPRLGDEASREACRTLSQVLRADLRFEGVQFVPESLFAALPPLNPESPNFEDWRSVGANFLAITRAQVTGGELTVEARVFTVDGRQAVLSKRYSGRADNPRSFAHQASDDIMMGVAQRRGVARTRIAFTSDRDATKDRRAKELYIVDYDGHNPRRITVNNSLNILPAWRPDGRALAYVSYRQGGPSVFVAHIFEGRSENLTKNEGQAFAPAFSPDGKRIAYASNKSGNMDIWVANADGTGAHRITTTSASETAPTWSPTGQEIAFTSDRAGSPQIYLTDSEGLNVRRLTTVGNWNDAPAWNPSREFSEIAYTARLEAGGFDIAVVDLGRGQVRQVTAGRGSCEYPSWAPNGRHLVFSCKRGSTWQITVSDREGRTVNTLATGAGNNVQPDWGP